MPLPLKNYKVELQQTPYNCNYPRWEIIQARTKAGAFLAIYHKLTSMGQVVSRNVKDLTVKDSDDPAVIAVDIAFLREAGVNVDESGHPPHGQWQVRSIVEDVVKRFSEPDRAGV